MVEAGTPYSAIDGPAAERACRAALAKFPDHPRLLSFLGDALFSQDKQREGVAVFRRAAELGDPTGQTSLGIAYYYGFGVGQSYAEAVSWMQRAEAQDYPGAWVALGIYHEDGRGTTRSFERAAEYFGRAHAAGDPVGSSLLGRLHEHGRGLPRDPNRAADLYILALKGGIEWMYTTKQAWTPETGRAVQLRLRDLGYYDGAIDGAIGPGTKAAMQALRNASL